MVLFDAAEIVEVVDHEPNRLLYAFIAQIRGPVDRMQTGAVAQVEPRDWVHRQSVSTFCDEVLSA